MPIAMLALLATACSEPATAASGQIFGVISACAPAPSVATHFYYAAGAFTVAEGSTLSDVKVGIESKTDFDGEVTVALVNSDEFSGGIGIEYEESLALESLPTTVIGPGDFNLVLIVEHLPQNDAIVFTRVEFDIDDQTFISRDGDVFELEIAQGGC